MPPGPQGWTPPPPPDPRRLPTHLQPALPIEERDYYAFWRAPRLRWWKPILAALMATFLFLAVSTVLQFIGWTIDGVDLSVLLEGTIPPVGPGFFLANNLSLALCIPIAMVTAWACVQQRPRWLSSVVGGLRWGWLGKLLVFLVPLWVVVIGGSHLLGPLDDVRLRDHTLVMVVGILLTTPLQAAGEEYLVRGLLGRIVGSWFRAPVIGFVASTVVTAAVFMAMHGAGDPWLNAFYVVFAAVGSWLTWRTGGLEAAIAIHAVHNTVSMALLPFVDFSEMFNREAGVGDATVLIPMTLLLVGAGVVEYLARRSPRTVRSAPGRAQWDALTAPRPGFGWGPPQPGGPR
ncbi:MAG TPA: CPBP family intramembrane metalloprotease [Propionibacterium sp.]|nr:CPBP family intramembrane metalloprotease [Propionibacterium sp.]